MDCLHLTDQSTPGPFRKSYFSPLAWEILKGADYRISTQAAFWKKDSLMKIIELEKSAWEFENTANKSIEKQPSKIFCVSREIVQKNKFEVLPYIFTGIIKGKWNKEVKLLFKENNIEMNYKYRGVYHESILTKILKYIIFLRNRL
jgi:hypothetical protein